MLFILTFARGSKVLQVTATLNYDTLCHSIAGLGAPSQAYPCHSPDSITNPVTIASISYSYFDVGYISTRVLALLGGLF